MDERPQTWHYGLIARWWAEAGPPEPDELAYYRGAIEEFGQPALDLGCGAGRLLVPLLAAGLDVDGADISPDMLARAAERAAAAGFAPSAARPGRARDRPAASLPDHLRLRRDRDRRYPRAGSARVPAGLRAPGARGILRDRARAAVRGPGRGPLGALAARPARAVAARVAGRGRSAPDVGRGRARAPGPPGRLRSPRQRLAYEVRARLWSGGSVVTEEERRLTENLYFAQELVLMLEDAGFARDPDRGPPHRRPRGARRRLGRLRGAAPGVGAVAAGPRWRRHSAGGPPRAATCPGRCGSRPRSPPRSGRGRSRSSFAWRRRRSSCCRAPP